MAKVSCIQGKIVRHFLKRGLLTPPSLFYQKNRVSLLLLCWALTVVMLLLVGFSTVAHAHSSGPPRLADVAAGPYRVFVWTQPEPLRVGDAHISMLVTHTTQPVNDAHVQMRFEPVGQAGQAIVVTASAQDFLSNIYYEADVQLPSTGNWRATIRIDGAPGQGSVEFESAVLEKRTLNWPVVGGAAAVFVFLLGLIGVWSRMQTKKASPVTAANAHRALRTEIKR